MSNFTSTPYDWVRQIPKEQVKSDEIPLWGNPPPFSWEQFSSELAAALKLDSLSVRGEDIRWREPDELLEGLGTHPDLITLSISPLQGKAFWAISKESILRLMKLLFGKEPAFAGESFIEGFYTFLAAEAINAFQKLEFDKSLTPGILEEKEIPNETCLGIDISLTLSETTFFGRLLISKELRQSIKEYYSKDSLSFSSAVNHHVELTLQLLAGSSKLSKQEWRESRPGDVLILDSCSLSPGEDKGRVIIALNGMPLFRAKIKDGNIKILEYPLFREEQTAMAKDYEDEEEETEHTEESEFNSESDFEESEEHFDTGEEEITEEEESGFETEPSMEYSEEESEAEHEEEEEEEKPSKPLTKNGAAQAQLKPKEQTPEGQRIATQKAPEKPLVNLDEIPVTISVEVGRLQMTIQKLMELSPGNLLELDVHPENGVDLVVNGKCVAKGELLRVGEVLGVRILDKI